MALREILGHATASFVWLMMYGSAGFSEKGGNAHPTWQPAHLLSLFHH